MFWVTCVIFDKAQNDVWACHTGTGFPTLEEARREVEFKRQHYPEVVAAYIKTDDGKTAWADCYTSPMGLRYYHEPQTK